MKNLKKYDKTIQDKFKVLIQDSHGKSVDFLQNILMSENQKTLSLEIKGKKIPAF